MFLEVSNKQDSNLENFPSAYRPSSCSPPEGCHVICVVNNKLHLMDTPLSHMQSEL